MLISFISLSIIIIILAGFLFITFWPNYGGKPSAKENAEYRKCTDLFYNGKFHNAEHFKLKVWGNNNKSKREIAGKKKPDGVIPVEKLKSLPKVEKDKLTVTWFGHSTSLLQMHGMVIFIDPMLSKHSSPINIGNKRMAEVPMAAKDLPEIDMLLLSHDHFDHLDYETIKQIDHKVKKYIVPLGAECHLKKWDVREEKVSPISWWDEININGLKVSATPGQHYSGRNFLKKGTTWWCGYVLQDEYHSIYYTGDTGYGEFLKEIKKRYGNMDLILSEDGQYEALWPYCHMYPEQVLKAAEDVGAKWLIPIHWAGFVLAKHAWNEPPELLTEYAQDSPVSIATPKIGQTVDYNEIGQYQEKWWREV